MDWICEGRWFDSTYPRIKEKKMLKKANIPNIYGGKKKMKKAAKKVVKAKAVKKTAKK